MSVIPALLAVQITLNASARQSYGRGIPPRTRGFRSLSERGLDLKGWRRGAYTLFVICCILVGVLLVMATIGCGIALSAWAAAAFSPWWLLASVPCTIAAVLGILRLMFRVILD